MNKHHGCVPVQFVEVDRFEVKPIQRIIRDKAFQLPCEARTSGGFTVRGYLGEAKRERRALMRQVKTTDRSTRR